ncbi:MAG: glycosyltransferase family 2 protein [Proteobacteria bacterium]|nr:glycosyltransferase family 2 protein [Pseudomonadota bacterium]
MAIEPIWQKRQPMSIDTQRNLPLVSIGIPVYNEAKFLEQALASLLAQDYARIEFILSDNASTDGTREICERTAAADARVRAMRALVNEGSTANFQRCLDAARGELFMWAGGHDLWSSNMVSQCVAALAYHSGAVIAVPESQWIDPSDQPYGVRACILDTRGMDPLARIFAMLWANMHAVYGLMRISALRATGSIPNYPAADLVLLSKMILQGDFVPVPDALWSRRQTRASEDYAARQRRYHGSDFGIRRRIFPALQLSFELLRVVWSSGLTPLDKIAFTLAFPAQLPARYLVAKRRVA